MTHVVEQFWNLALDKNKFSQLCLLYSKKLPRLESEDRQLESVCKEPFEVEFSVKLNARSRLDRQIRLKLNLKFCLFLTQKNSYHFDQSKVQNRILLIFLVLEICKHLKKTIGTTSQLSSSWRDCAI